MPVVSLRSEYKGENRDRVENFHGNQLLFVLWADHLSICAPIALPVPPTLTFADLIDKVLAVTSLATHPDWASIDWSHAVWELSHVSFTPEAGKTLAELGIGHKAFLTLRTPGLMGFGGSSN